jgi:hypothetical protein
MTNIKEPVREILTEQPDDATFEDANYRLYHFETLRKRDDVADREDFIPTDEHERRFSKAIVK